MLLTDLLPEIEDRSERQRLGMEGADLSDERKAEICARAPTEIPLKLIEQVGEERFLVRSCNQEKFYSINTMLKTCDCLDFPRVKLCKHLAAVQHHFGIAEPPAPTPQQCPIAPELHHAQGAGNTSQNTTRQANATASLISTVGEIITLSRQLLDQAPNATQETVKSLRAVRSHLSVVATTAASNGQELPEKEAIAPNQLSWPETADRMGVKRGQKRQGKVNGALSAQLIGEPNRKRNCATQDPYGAGKQPGKRARPDARSVAANTRARAAAEPAPVHVSLPATLPPPRPSSHAAPMDAPHNTPAQPLSLSQPAPASFTYIPPPYMPYPYSVPMYYPPTQNST